MSRRNSWELFGALVLIALGVLLLGDNLGLFVFNWNVIWALILVGIGVWTIWRALQPAPLGSNLNMAFYGIGDYHPDLSAQELKRENFSHGFGNLKLDLTRAVIPDGESVVRASHGFGDVKVIVPHDLAVRVTASAGFGDVTLFGKRSDGIAPRLDYKSDDYATATRKLDIEASVGFGDVKVIRA